MLLKILGIFIAGMIETFLYTGWCLAANKKKIISSSLLMLIYMIIYLSIIDYAIKDANTLLMILTYALSCGVGNFMRVFLEKYDIYYMKHTPWCLTYGTDSATFWIVIGTWRWSFEKKCEK